MFCEQLSLWWERERVSEREREREKGERDTERQRERDREKIGRASCRERVSSPV